jgi:hypothetical protein
MPITKVLEHWDQEFESNLRHMSVVSALCCSVNVVTLRRADPPSKESY